MTITDEMVERAAEAICNKAERVKQPGTIWRIKSDEAQERYRSQARAALEAALRAAGIETEG